MFKSEKHIIMREWMSGCRKEAKKHETHLELCVDMTNEHNENQLSSLADHSFGLTRVRKMLRNVDSAWRDNARVASNVARSDVTADELC
jgi:hypothetical protein